MTDLTKTIAEAIGGYISGADICLGEHSLAARDVLQAIRDAGFAVVPVEPTEGKLMSMALRYDHGLGAPGYYDQPLFGAALGDHARRLEAAMRTMRKLHEEVVGAGFYSPEREDEYRAMVQAAMEGK